MTLENLLSQVGMGTKQQLTDRYSEYGAPVHDQHVYYAYETPSHGHVASSKHNYGGGHKSNASMSALTLLAFLFFLHILQQCIKDHMTDMSNAPIMVMTAGREGEDLLKTTSNKIDKAGLTQKDTMNKMEPDDRSNINTEYYNAENPFKNDVESRLTKINVAEHTPTVDVGKYNYVVKNYANYSTHPGFIKAMDKK